jgi:hypothetical protein
MASRILQRMTLAAVLASGMGLVLSQAATARPLPGVRRTARPAAAHGFNLFAGAVQLTINANRVQCGMNNIGEQCVDATNSPTLGGGFWPKGSPDQYNFNGGLQLAAVIPGTKAQFAWGGDTVGAYFFDGRGDQTVGTGLTNMYTSTSKDDRDNWPCAGYVTDPTLYDPALLSTRPCAPGNFRAMSQQDTWVRYWDGNVNLLTGRDHPMGILVDQRTMAWSFPTGNQDIIYFVERFINISSTIRSRYDGLAAYGYSSTDIDDIVLIAQTYHDAVLAKFGVTIPDSGYQLTQFFGGPQEDPDVVAGGTGNYSTANLPFSMDFAYHGVFYAPTQQYPPDIFYGPFAAPVPGFQGNKFLKGPADSLGHQIGITMFTNTTNGGVFPDRFGSQALWRLASNHLLPVDGQCNVPINTPMCAAVQSQADTRMYMFSGPLTINPGESQVVVFADVYAAAYNPAIQTDGLGHTLGSTSFDMKPGFPGTPGGYVRANSRVGQVGLDTLRMIDRATGWNSTGPFVDALDANADGILQQTEIPVIKNSLLDKALVAQTVFDNKFLLPYAPDAPPFYLIPGDNQVTVVWQPSLTETPGQGDPYYNVASNPLSPAYDRNYRANDVEGYRIYRGRTQSDLTLVAQFDYAGTYMTDYTGTPPQGAFDYGNHCAPELGVTSGCPTFPQRVPLIGNVVQIRLGGRTTLSNGDVIYTQSDTAVTGGGAVCGKVPCPGLTDTGVPFAYVDTKVLDGFQYYYVVTAFDVNSFASGPSSLESSGAGKSVVPVAPSGQVATGTLGAPQLIGTDGTALDPNAALPTIGASTGIFSGPMPPTNAMALGLAAFIPEVLQSGAITVTVDSIVPGSWLTNVRAATYWFTGQGAGAPVKFSIPITGAGTSASSDATGNAVFLATSMDSALAARYGGDNSYYLYGSVTIKTPGDYRLSNKARSAVNEGTSYNDGPRWWTGAANENTNDPNGIVCGANYSCVLGDLSRNAGAISGVGIMNIVSYNTVASSVPARDIEGITSTVFRAADFKWYWGANGAVDSVVDVVHHVRVPFSTRIRASWGILNDSSFVGVPAANTPDGDNTKLTWTDYACVDPAPAYLATCNGGAAAVFQNHARLSPVAFASSGFAGGGALAVNGNGFILYLAGNFFLMRMAALPAVGTVWNMRTYAGNVTGSLGSYGYTSATRPAAVPGLRVRIQYTGSTLDASITADSLLARVHTVPDPYYVTNQLEITANTKVLRFVNLPSQAIIRIYSVSGILVNLLTHNDNTGGGEEVWNLRNRNNQFVASGVYFYHVETPDGRKKIGRFTVVNYAQ